MKYIRNANFANILKTLFGSILKFKTTLNNCVLFKHHSSLRRYTAKWKQTKHKIDRNPSIATHKLYPFWTPWRSSVRKLIDETPTSFPPNFKGKSPGNEVDETLDWWLLVTSPQFYRGEMWLLSLFWRILCQPTLLKVVIAVWRDWKPLFTAPWERNGELVLPGNSSHT